MIRNKTPNSNSFFWITLYDFPSHHLQTHIQEENELLALLSELTAKKENFYFSSSP